MEEPPSERDATDDVAIMANSSWVNDVSSLTTRGAEVPMTRRQGDSAAGVICEALHLALSAIHIDLAWHAGVVSAEASMEALHRAVSGATSGYKRSTPAGGSGTVRRPPPHRTAAGRTPGLGSEMECNPLSAMLPTA